MKEEKPPEQLYGTEGCISPMEELQKAQFNLLVLKQFSKEGLQTAQS